MKTLIVGAGGQVGRALVHAFPDATAVDRAALDIADPPPLDGWDVVVNAAGWTDVDGAETDRAGAWRANAAGPAALARAAGHAVLVHFSSEYVFDGTLARPYREDDPLAPLSVYGAAKAAGDLAVSVHEQHYLLRPTWVVGQGRNFVATMRGLAARGVEPAVVDDQVGRPTFAADLAAAVAHLLAVDAPFGTYHVTGGGEPASWHAVARAVYDLAGRADLTVKPISTEAYAAGRPGTAPRPRNSVLDTAKAVAVGVTMPDWRERLAAFLTPRP